MKRGLVLCWLAFLLVGCSRSPKPQSASGQAAEIGPRPGADDPVRATLPVEPTPAGVIPSGTIIRVRLEEALGTRFSRPGERFRATLDQPIVVGDRVVVPKGTAFRGHVIEARPSGRLKGRAVLLVTLDSFRLHDTTYPVRIAADLRSSRSHKRRNLAVIGGGSGGGAAIGAIAGGGVGALIGAGAGAVAGTTGALITGRRQITLPAETPMIFTLRGPVQVRG